MDFEAAVTYGPGIAWYRISRENAGIYAALLLSFDGGEDQGPPDKVTLVRAISGWRGSSEDGLLVDKLGRMIEAYVLNTVKKQKRK